MQDPMQWKVYGARRLITVAIADVLILVELCVAMFFAAQSSDVNSTFMTIFFGTCIPTIVATVLVLRYFRKRYGTQLQEDFVPEGQQTGPAMAAVPASQG